MLLTKKIKLKINSGFHIKYFKDNNMNVKMGDEIEIDISLLPKGSHETVHATCDYCGDEKELFYKEYNNSMKSNNKFCCAKCLPLKREEIFMIKYGVTSYPKTSEFVEKSKITSMKKYGVSSYTKTDEYKEKCKKTSIEKYGVEHYSKTIKFKENNNIKSLENYGTDYPVQNKIVIEKIQKSLFEKTGYKHALQNPKSIEKSKKTSLEKYGVTSYTKTDEYKKEYKLMYSLKPDFQKEKMKFKFKNTSMLNYGVEYPMQNIKIFEKQQISAFKLKKYKELYYRGTYELDFLEKFYDKIKIENSNSIRYNLNNKLKIYFPDFYLPDYNLIVEIKSSYTYNFNIEMNEAKKKYTLENDYKFIFIIDKDYTEFINKINQQ